MAEIPGIPGWPGILYSAGSWLSRAGVGSGSTLFSDFFGDVAKNVAGTPPIAPTPGINPTAPSPVTGEQLFEDLLGRGQVNPKGPPSEFERIIYRQTPTPPSDFERLMRGTYRPPDVSAPTARPGGLAAILSRASLLIGGLLYPGTIADSDLGYKAPKKKPGGSSGEPPGKGPTKRPRIKRRPRRPPSFPRIPPDWLFGPDNPSGYRYPEPQTLPRSRTEPRVRTAQPQPLPVPAPKVTTSPETVRQPTTRVQVTPRAVPRPAPASRPSGNLLPLPILPWLFPAPSPRPRNVSQPFTASGPSLPNLAQPLPRGLTQVQPRTLPSPLTASAPGCPPCNCSKPTRTKRKRKPRTECYRGEYVEKANGLTKFRKRKIPCQ